MAVADCRVGPIDNPRYAKSLNQDVLRMVIEVKKGRRSVVKLSRAAPQMGQRRRQPG